MNLRISTRTWEFSMTVSRLSFRSSCAVSSAILAAALLAFSGGSALAQQQDQDSSGLPTEVTPSRLVNPIDEHVLVTLKGNVRQDVARAPDLGPVEDTKPLHLFLLLQRSTAQQADLDNLIARQQQPGASEYHKWLAPAEFGARFGASPQDIATLSAWLQSHGFEVRGVLNNASMIDFAATAGQVLEAFHTQLHYVNIQGGKYPALIQDPQIPAALAPVVVGIKGLNKIPAQTNHTELRQTSWDQDTHTWHIVNPTSEDIASPAYNNGSGYYLVTPQDFYTIYKVNPVFTGGNLAGTATVAVIEESDIEYGTVNSGTGAATGGDVATFRTLFGVPGTLNMHVYHGYGTVTCNDPGIDPNGSGEDGEASLDAEWINATAPSANEIFMSCDQNPDDGIFTSMAALIDNNLSDVMSLSYGESELYYTSASDYTFLDNLFAQAATQGQSILISSGDSGSDVKDQNTSGTATSGINVTAFGSPMVTLTGGTDFQDLYDAGEGGPAQSTYWGATNSTYYNDALSYVPETAWNNSCASSIIANYEGYTGAGFCGTGSFATGDVVGGSGGISTHYAVPSWQTGISGYSNSMRSQPDIAGFAANGVWGHYLIFCDSHESAPCTSTSTFGGAGGTSFVAPYMAGVFGLLRTATGSRQGVLNPALYALAKAQYTNPSTQTACYANGQSSNIGGTTGLPAAACIFNDITTSNNDVPCAAGSTSCYVNSGKSYGMLSLTGSSSLTVAYPSTVGYDQVTGIGTVNVNNLIADWNTAFTSSTALNANPTSINSSQSTELTATVTGGTPTGYVDTPPALTGTATFKAGTTVVGSCTLSAGTCSTSVPGSSLQSGANSMTAIFGGSGTYPSSTSSIVTVTVQNGTPTPIVPYLQVNGGAWQQVASVAVNVGDTVNLGPQPQTGGSWSWTGPNGFTSTSRVLNAIALTSASNVYTATYTNTSGANSTQAFTITINPTTIVPYLQVNGGAWQQSSTVAVNVGDTVNLGPQPQTGGSWSWTGPNGFTSTSRVLNSIALTSASNVYTATYTNTDGVNSTQAFTITINPTPIVPYLQVNGGAWQQLSSITVNVGDTVNLGPQPQTGGTWRWTGPNGFTSTSRVINSIAITSPSNVYTATYTNTDGVNSTQAFTITVNSTPIVPYLQVNGGAWQQLSSITVNVGDTVNLGPQPQSGGTWSWTGPNGFTSTSRVLNSITLTSSSNVYTATYTNTDGVNSTQAFTITVNSTPIVPYLQVNGGAWQQVASVSVNVGDTVNLGPQPQSGGTWSWTGPNGFTSTSRVLNSIALTSGTNVYTATYTNVDGVAGTPQAFTITINPTPIVPYLQVNGGPWQQASSATVNSGATVNLGPQPQSGGTWSWTGPNGFTSTSREIDAVPLTTGSNVYTATFKNTDGVASTQTFTITVN
jgi:hypothetical protein